jgi:putative FmdB family regulatory protein
MPLYEYLCEKCQHLFEVIQRFSDSPIEVCPRCGGKVNKVLSSPAIHFKGTGWYITDYARKPAQAQGDAAKGEAAKADGGAKTEGTASESGEAKKEGKAETSPPPAAKPPAESAGKNSKTT